MPQSLARATTLAEQLLAWIAEDEEFARRIPSITAFDTEDAVGFDEQWWQTDRVLAECAAKRQVVELHPVVGAHGPIAVTGSDITLSASDGECATCRDGWDSADFPCPTLLALAQPYADRPEFRDEWRA